MDDTSYYQHRCNSFSALRKAKGLALLSFVALLTGASAWSARDHQADDEMKNRAVSAQINTQRPLLSPLKPTITIDFAKAQADAEAQAAAGRVQSRAMAEAGIPGGTLLALLAAAYALKMRREQDMAEAASVAPSPF